MQSRTERQQHAAAQRQKRARNGLAGLTATVVVAAVALGVSQATGDTGTDGAPPCVNAAPITTPGLPTDQGEALVAVVADHLGGSCSRVRPARSDESDQALRLGPPVITSSSGSTTAAGPTPPADADAPPSTTVATSPVVLAMPVEMAEALDATALDTPMLRSLLTDPKAWAGRGHPEWGTFTIDSPDPATTALGAAAFTGLAGVANGGPVDKALDYAPPRRLRGHQLEHALRTESRTEPALPRPATVADSAAIASAFVTTESDLARYAASKPAVPMTGFPVAGGAAVVDWVVSAPASASPQLRKEASVVTAALKSTRGRAALPAAGLRTSGGAEPTPAAPGITAETLAEPAPSMNARDRAAAASQWSAMRTRISTLVVLDTSGSMDEGIPGSKASKIDVVRALAAQSYTVASPLARSGVVAFRADAGKPAITTVAPLRRNDTAVGATIHSAASTAALAKVPVGGGTPLFEAIRTAYDTATKNYDPGYVNQVLVLTDGKNEDTTSRLTEAQLREHLSKTYDEDKPVRIVAIAFNAEDLTVLTRIVSPTRGKAVSAQTMAQVPEAVRFGLFAS